jgi:hypothetical protein
MPFEFHSALKKAMMGVPLATLRGTAEAAVATWFVLLVVVMVGFTGTGY